MPALSTAPAIDVVVLGPAADRRDALVADLARTGLAARAGGAEDTAQVVVALDDLDAVRVRAEDERCRVLAVVDAVDRRTATVLLDLGADGIALAGEPAAVVAEAVRAVAAGYIVVPRAVRQALRRPVLTARQKQILSLLVLGLSNSDIAQRLYLSESTIKTHLTAIFTKLGVKSRKEAIDLILDPTSGLGAGILGIPDAARVQSGYGTPTVR